MDKKVLCEFNDISKGFSGIEVLRSISSKLFEGECISLFGHNGSGKSTLLSILAGAAYPDSGNLQVLGSKPNAEVFRKVGYCPQSSALIDELTVLDNIRLWKNACKSIRDDNSILNSFDLSGFATKKVGALSGGMKKGVMLAVAFLNNPRLIILDEPFAALDSARAETLKNNLRKAKSDGAGIIMSSHSIDEILGIADRAMVIKNGSFSARFTASELMGTPSEIFSELYKFF